MALARAHAQRERLDLHASSGSYRATNTDRARPILRDGSGDRHADPWSRRMARELARDQDRSSGIYRSLVTTFLDLCIGRGVMPRPTTDDAEWNKQALELFLSECDSFDTEGADTYAGLQRKWGRSVVNDGDMLLVKLPDAKLATIEADRIDGRKQGLNQYRRLIGGVLIDASTGQRLEYGVCPYAATGFVNEQAARWYQADQVIYTGTASRKSQVRSLPALVASLDDSERADSLIESEIITAEQASMIWGFIKDPNGTGSGGVDPLAARNADGSPAVGGRSNTGEVKYTDWVAGVLGMLGNREFVQAQTAKPNLNTVEFLKGLMRMFGAELGVAYELAMLDVGELSWSSNQALLAFCERRLAVWRDQVFGPQYSSVYLWRIKQAIESGKLKEIDGWWKHEHDWPLPPTLNGPDQVTTDKGNLEIGRTSLRRIAGHQWQSILHEQAEEQRVRDSLAITRIVAIEEQIAAARKKLPGLQSLSWAHVITLGGAITAPGAYLQAAVGQGGGSKPPADTPLPALPAPPDDKKDDDDEADDA